MSDEAPMLWHISHRFDPRAVALADRHYSRQKVGTPQFVAPGRCLVLITAGGDAAWVTSWPYPQYTKHQWADAWICTFFRNESPWLSSLLITQAVAATREQWATPSQGIITFIDTTAVRRKRDWGRCYRKSGWTCLPDTNQAGTGGTATRPRGHATQIPSARRPNRPVAHRLQSRPAMRRATTATSWRPA